MYKTRLIGSGKYLPQNIVTNDDLVARGVETSDEWIVERTGIKQRHIAADGEFTSDLAIKAAQAALAHAKLTPADIDMVVLATTTPDNTFPATAVKVQAALGMPAHSFAFDVQAVCSGFVYALAVADNFIKTGQVRRAIVIGAETFTRLLDWNDRTTCVLFGDGAGAVICERAEGDSDKGIISTHLHSDGSQYSLLSADGGPSTTGTTGVTTMNGPEVFKHAVRRLSEVVEETLQANNLTPEAIDWLVPHQANKRIIDGTAKKLDMPPEKVVLTVSQHGNTSAASIPLALATAVEDGRIQPGQLLLLEAMGAGFTWGSALVRWG